MSRTRRLREAVLVFLEEKGNANTVEVFDHLNERFRWGATVSYTHLRAHETLR